MSLKKNLVANYLGLGWAALMGLAFTPLYIKYLGVEAYGLIGFFAMLQAWLTLLDVGMAPTLNREVARYTAGAYPAPSIRDLVRTFEIVCCGLAVLIAGTLFAFSDWIAQDWLNARALPAADVAHSLSLMGLAAALLFVEGLYRGGLLGFQKHVWLNLVSAFFATARWAGGVLILALGWPTIRAFFLWQAIVSVASVGVLMWGLRRNLPAIDRPPRFSVSAFSEAWMFARGMFVTTLLALLLTQIDKLLLSRLLSLEAFGTYMVAVTVAGALTVLSAPIAQSYYPRLTELVARGDQKAVVAAYHQGAQLVSVMLVPAGLVLAAFSQPLVLAWSGNHSLAVAASPIVSVLAVGTILSGLMYVPHVLQLAYGWSTLAAWINAVAVAILLPTLFVVVPRFGPIGAAWVWFAVNAGYVLFSAQLMHLRLLPGEKNAWYLRDVLLPSAAAIAIIAVAALVQPSFSSALSNLLWVALSSVVAYVAAALASSQFRGYLLRLAASVTAIRR